jgi:hypothetical protein
MDSDSHGLFEPDAVLASQFFDAIRRLGLPEGEYRLMLAVFADAVRCFVQHAGSDDPAKRALYQDAERWFARSADPGLYSFESICDVLGVDANLVRCALRTQRDAALAHRRPAPTDAAVARS